MLIKCWARASNTKCCIWHCLRTSDDIQTKTKTEIKTHNLPPPQNPIHILRLERERKRKNRERESCPFCRNAIPYAIQIDWHIRRTECRIRLFDSKIHAARRLTWPILYFGALYSTNETFKSHFKIVYIKGVCVCDCVYCVQCTQLNHLNIILETCLWLRAKRLPNFSQQTVLLSALHIAKWIFKFFVRKHRNQSFDWRPFLTLDNILKWLHTQKRSTY